MLAKSYVLGLVRRPMIIYDPRLEARVHAVYRGPVHRGGNGRNRALPGGGEGMAVSYALDPRAKWGDGTPITTRDVVFTWEVGATPQSGVAAHSYYLRVLSIDVTTNTATRFTTTRLDYDYPTVGAFSLWPEHLERDIFEKTPDYRNRTRYETEPGHPGLYHGPYRITEVARGSHIRFGRNPQWWRREPYFERIVVAPSRTPSPGGEPALRDGRLHRGRAGASDQPGDRVRGHHGDRFVVEYQPGLIYETLTRASTTRSSGTRASRRALLTGLDRAAISERLFGRPAAGRGHEREPARLGPFRGDPEALLRSGGGRERCSTRRDDAGGRTASAGTARASRFASSS